MFYHRQMIDVLCSWTPTVTEADSSDISCGRRIFVFMRQEPADNEEEMRREMGDDV